MPRPTHRPTSAGPLPSAAAPSQPVRTAALVAGLALGAALAAGLGRGGVLLSPAAAAASSMLAVEVPMASHHYLAEPGLGVALGRVARALLGSGGKKEEGGGASKLSALSINAPGEWRAGAFHATSALKRAKGHPDTPDWGVPGAAPAAERGVAAGEAQTSSPAGERKRRPFPRNSPLSLNTHCSDPYPAHLSLTTQYSGHPVGRALQERVRERERGRETETERKAEKRKKRGGTRQRERARARARGGGGGGGGVV